MNEYLTESKLTQVICHNEYNMRRFGKDSLVFQQGGPQYTHNPCQLLSKREGKRCMFFGCISTSDSLVKPVLGSLNGSHVFIYTFISQVICDE